MSFRHLSVKNKKELKPIFVFGFIKFCSINCFEAISKLTELSFENSFQGI